MYTNIYQPTLAEVHPLFVNFVNKNLDISGLPKRAGKAQQILLTGGIVWAGSGWHARSQSSPDLYRVNGSCECKDRGVPVQSEDFKIKICKHQMANYAYHRVLIQHLNILSNTHVDIEEFNVYRKGTEWRFCTESAQFEFSNWLVVDGGRMGFVDYESNHDADFQERLNDLAAQGEYERSLAYDGVTAWMV